jgi:hypothetical protein
VPDCKTSLFVDRAVERLAPFVVEDADRLRLHHPCLASWLQDEKQSEVFHVNAADGHRILAAYLLCLNARGKGVSVEDFQGLAGRFRVK